MRKISRRSLGAAIVAAAVAGGAYGFFGSSLVPAVQARWHDYPRLEAAHHALRDAKAYLEEQPHDFHGHRREAVHAIEAAMLEVSICADEHDRAATKIDPTPLGTHEKLRHAKDELKGAREFLHESRRDFHGHKEAAVHAIDVAIHHIEICLDF